MDYVDADGDGYAACAECDDSEASNHPGAAEHCDSVDNNCDGEVDEATAVDALTWYRDADLDAFGDPGSPDISCVARSGFIADSTDCDDSLASVYPGAPEYCGSVDHDCDGLADEQDSVDVSTWHPDVDLDGYGLGSSATNACTQPAGEVSDDTDCDDSDPAVSPAATEICNSRDDDCDGLTDDADTFDAATGTIFYADLDSDGDGDPEVTATRCAAGSGWVSSGDDCDDSRGDVHPAAPEVCDSLDNDCDGAVDEDAGYFTLWYADADGDLYGDASASTSACTAPSGDVSDGSDCDDADPSLHADADADGTCDPLDGDGDGYPLADGDCDDDDASVNPAASETCSNGVDDDCDGAAPGCALSDMSMTDADAEFTGAAVYASVGATLAGAGDVNGDGFDDVLIGEPYFDGYVGVTGLMLGPSLGTVSLADADVRFSGTSVYDQLGTHLAGAGDTNADGYTDMIFGAPANIDAYWQGGATYLVLGVGM